MIKTASRYISFVIVAAMIFSLPGTVFGQLSDPVTTTTNTLDEDPLVTKCKEYLETVTKEHADIITTLVKIGLYLLSNQLPADFLTLNELHERIQRLEVAIATANASLLNDGLTEEQRRSLTERRNGYKRELDLYNTYLDIYINDPYIFDLDSELDELMTAYAKDRQLLIDVCFNVIDIPGEVLITPSLTSGTPVVNPQ